jgi:hypothetical protein
VVEPWRRVLLKGATWRVLGGSSAPPSTWASRDCDDSAWAAAAAPIGYGPPGLVATTIPMQGAYLTFYARHEFEVTDPAAVTDLELALSYDDGFVAFLNGSEIARRGVAPNQTQNTAGRGHESGIFEECFLPQALRFLLQGKNVLAI